MNKEEIQKEYDKVSDRLKLSNKVLGVSMVASMVSVPVFITSCCHGLSAIGSGAALLASTTAVLATSFYTSITLNSKKDDLSKELESHEEEVKEVVEEVKEEVKELTQDNIESNQVNNTYSNVVSINSTRKRVLKPNNNQNK